MSVNPDRRLSAHPIAAAAAAAIAALVSGCATPPAAAPEAAAPAPAAAATAAAPAASGAARAAAPAARPPEPGAPRPFADVSKDAKRDDGFIPVWRKDEKVWLEIAPDRLNKPLLFTVNVAQSVGERGLYASQMGPDWMVEFRRVGNQLQVIALQTDFRAPGDPASARAVAEGFSESLVAAGPVTSAEHPERKSFLVDASFLLGDLISYGTGLERAFRLPFAPDRTNSSFTTVRAEGGLTTLSAKVHFSVARLPAPPLLPPGAPVPMLPPPPQVTPDPRSLFVGFVYNFRELPAQPMEVRHADPRVGYFTTSYSDLSDDLRANPRVHPINRWRLEKKDPAAALSEPVKPITWWLDRNIPRRYRGAVEAGILEWNKAFERIGFKNAIVVKQQPDDAEFDNMDAGHASIRWFLGADVGFAQGPSHVDPRTGEILDADIRMSDVFGRGSRRQARDDVALPLGDTQAPAWKTGLDALGLGRGHQACTYASEAGREMGFALDLLEARGELEPDSPATEEFVRNYIKDVITHEVGHTLGLRHNFKASTTVTRAQLLDKAYGSKEGISGSVMDYNAFNLPLKGEAKGEANMVTLGRYDFFAIEYGYKPLAGAKAAEELKAIAARGTNEPALAFADDADAGGIDPLVNVFDLGDDPLAHVKRRVTLSKELWERVQARPAQLGDDPLRARRSVMAGFAQIGRMPDIAAKYVGGMITSRAQPGEGKPTFTPVDSARQREALGFLTAELFSIESFRFKPEFLAAMTPDYIEWNRVGTLPVPQAVLQLQTQAMDSLLAAGTARRLLDLPNYLPEAQRKGAISLNEVYATLQGAVWSELKSGKAIEPLRRNLQREHLRRLQALLTRPTPALPADAISLARLQAVELQSQLKGALANKGGMTVENRAHLEDALALVTEALRASMQRG